MRYDDVLRGLADLREPLPEPAEILMPVLVGGGDLRPSRTPPAGRSGRPAAVLVLLYPDERRRRAGRPDRAGQPRRPPQRRGQLPGRQGRTRGRRSRGDRAARGGRGDRARCRGSPGPRRRPPRDVLDPGQRLRSDPGRRGRSQPPRADRLARRGRPDRRAADGPFPAGRPDRDRRAARSASGRCATARTPSTACPCGARRPGSSASRSEAALAGRRTGPPVSFAP